MLDSRVRVLFLEDGTMTVQCPFSKDFNEALRDNSIYRTWNRAQKRWYFHGKDAGDVLKLLEDYFSIGTAICGML